MYLKKFIVSLAVISTVAMPLVFAASFGLNISHRNLADDTDVPQTINPANYDDGAHFIPYFEGRGDTGVYNFVNVGSGIGLSAGNLYVTPNTIETTEGHLTDTISAMRSAIGVATSSAASAVSSISSISSTVSTYTSSISAFDTLTAQINANLYGTSTNMRVGYGTSTVAGLLETKRWNAMVSAVASATSTIANLKTVATTGVYTDLTGKPTVGLAYEGTTTRTNSFPIFKSTTVSSGVAVFNLTSDGTSGGTALFPNGVIADSVNAFVSDATASYQMSYAFSNGNKTLTITVNKLTTANILTGILGQSAANGSVVKLQVYGY